MQSGKWYFDIEKTNVRKEKLNEYYKLKCLNADSFNCSFNEKCFNSIKSDCTSQYCGGTSAVSPLYDTYFNNKEIRVMVVGKEMAYMKNKKFGTSDNFENNCDNVLKCIGWEKKNNHIKGTLDTLEKIFGFRSDYLYSNYVLTNHLRCSYQKSEKLLNVSAVRDTKVMRTNCYQYLIDEIKILEPTLVIAQGEWSIKGKQSIVDIIAESLNENYEIIMKNSNEKYGLYKFRDFFVLTSHHPAILGNWRKNLAPDSVWPMLEYLKSNGFFPDITDRDVKDYHDFVVDYMDSILDNLPSNDILRK